MNERIRQLAKQAKLKTELWNNPEPFVIYKEDVNYPGGLEKFAELIVFECVKAVMDGTKEGDHYAQRIEQHFDNGKGGILHFGVEE